MTNSRIIQLDSVDAYNKLYGWETLHPLVTVVNHAAPCRPHADCCSILTCFTERN